MNSENVISRYPTVRFGSAASREMLHLPLNRTTSVYSRIDIDYTQSFSRLC